MAVRAQSISSGDVERGILLAAAALTMTQSVGNPADTYASSLSYAVWPAAAAAWTTTLRLR